MLRSGDHLHTCSCRLLHVGLSQGTDCKGRVRTMEGELQLVAGQPQLRMHKLGRWQWQSNLPSVAVS